MQERKIPTLVGLLLVLGAIVVFSVAFDRVSPLFSRASPTATPQRVTFSNLSDSTFTVSWITGGSATGFITYQTDGKKLSAYDDRDQVSIDGIAAKLGSFTTHSVTVRNTKPQTTYRINILSAGKTFQNDGKPYEITTALSIAETGSALEPAFGTITTPSGLPAEGAIVYLTIEGGQTLSALVKASGSWVVPLNLTRTEDLSQYLPVSERMSESIIARTTEGEATAVTDTLNDNPVPAMVIGKSYDFRKIQAEKLQNQQLANAQPAVLGESAAQSTPTVAITQPNEGAAIPSNLPLIQGTGVPGKKVFLIIGLTNPLTGETVVGADTVWRYTPAKPLSEGKQSVTITTTDSQGKPVALTHLFEVLKSGTQVLGVATPSATLTPTLEASSSPTSTLAGQPIPTTGSPLPLIILLILGFGLMAGGAALVIL